MDARPRGGLDRRALEDEISRLLQEEQRLQAVRREKQQLLARLTLEEAAMDALALSGGGSGGGFCGAPTIDGLQEGAGSSVNPGGLDSLERLDKRGARPARQCSPAPGVGGPRELLAQPAPGRGLGASIALPLKSSMASSIHEFAPQSSSASSTCSPPLTSTSNSASSSARCSMQRS